MKIVHAVHGYPPELIGGTELYVERLAREQAAAGHHVLVFSGSVDWREEFTVEEGEQDGVAVVRAHRNDLYFDRWDKGYNPLVAVLFERVLAAERPDVLHVHQWIRLTTNLVSIAARLGVPAVITAHDLYASCPRVFRLKGKDEDQACELEMSPEACVSCVPRWRFQKDEEVSASIASYREDMRRELDLARAIVAPSRSHGEFLARMLGGGVREIRVVPHGTLAESGARHAARAVAAGKIQLACFGHLHPWKGAHVLLEGLARCARKERFTLHLHGKFSGVEYGARLEQLAEGSDVVFHGAYSPRDLERAAIDVVVIPTLCRESYSFILDEAVLLGVPILAARAGAITERATGRVLLFEQNDPADLARRLEEIAGDPGLLAAMRVAPPPALVSFAEHAGRIEEVYRGVAAAGAPAPPPAADERERLAEQWERRETLFRELVRIERWEDVVAELRARVAELEARLHG
ncbi:MAG: glycosyltransferase [Planctomycetes bacterium]|nr:glycosyltransferase [Planctomycetota bacterium]